MKESSLPAEAVCGYAFSSRQSCRRALWPNTSPVSGTPSEPSASSENSYGRFLPLHF